MINKLITFTIIVPVYLGSVAIFSILTLGLGTLFFGDEIERGFRKIFEIN